MSRPDDRRVFHVLPEAEPFSEYDGGAISRWVANVLVNDSSGIVVCPSSDGSWVFDNARVLQMKGLRRYGRIRRLAMKLTAGPRKRIIRVLLRELIRTTNPSDVVWVHNRPEIAAALAQPLAKRKTRVVLHMHNSHLLEASREEIREITGIDAMFCSRFLMDEATTLWTDLRKTAVIYNGADEKLFYPATNKIEWEEAGRAPIVLFVGRLVPEKGAHVLIEAVEQLQRTGQKVHAEIVGAAGFGAGKHSEYSAGLLSRASESITFPGYLSGEGLAKKYRSSDIFCCPSIWNEPLGMINLEAMASGLPVVAARVGGIPEVLAGGGGVLVNPDDASGLAAALERMIREREFRIKCAGEAYESFKKQFSWSVVQERYREVLQQVETRN